MLKSPIPPRTYNTTDYANVDTAALGKRIPIGYGTLTNVTPVECNTTTHKWKILDQALAEITKIWSATKDPLVKDLDYTEDLVNGEFTLLAPVYVSTPGTYYFAVEADYTQSGTNYVDLRRNAAGNYSVHSYAIDSGDLWVADADDYNLTFEVLGKTSETASEEVIATNTSTDATPVIGLKDAEPRTRIGQAFTPSGTHFITKVRVTYTTHGTLTGKYLKVKIYSDTAGAQVGVSGDNVLIVSGTQTGTLTITQPNENQTLTANVKAPGTEYTKVADIVSDSLTTVMGKSASLLDATELANLDTDRTQDLKVYLKDAIDYGDFLAKLEAGQLWKFIALQDGTYGTVVPEDGTPANTPTFYDHDYLSFRMEYDSSQIKHQVSVYFDQDEATDDYPSMTVSSDVAKFFYMNEESHDVETYLVSSAAADTLADDYVARYEVPIITVTFEVHGWALDLLPFRDKVKLYRDRAPYGAGSLTGQLFRITKLVKRPESNVVEIQASIWANSAT